MKKTLLTIATFLALPIIASAHCGDCKADAKAKPKCEQKKCDKAKCSTEECQKKCDEYFDKAFKDHDKDKDGKLDQTEFKALVTATMAKKCSSKSKCCSKKSKCCSDKSKCCSDKKDNTGDKKEPAAEAATAE